MILVWGSNNCSPQIYDLTSFADPLSDFMLCPTLPPRASPPKNVNDLRVDDIKVVMAMGDSFISGLNSGAPFSQSMADESCRAKVKQFETRGTSFATGGDANFFSVGNGIKKYSPNVTGLSHGASDFEFCYGPLCPSGTFLQPFNVPAFGLNAAQSGSWVTRGNIDNQFKYFDLYYHKILANATESNPWKLMMLLMGFNNICLGCLPLADKLLFSADQYESNVRYALEKLQKQYGKMVVVISSPFKASEAVKIVDANPTCVEIRNMQKYGCPCLGYENLKGIPDMDRLAVEYGQRMKAVAEEYQAKRYDDFNVIYDPGLANINFNGAKASAQLSGYDCFHPARASHESIAVGMWNNLWNSFKNKKPYELTHRPAIFCPTVHSRITP